MSLPAASRRAARAVALGTALLSACSGVGVRFEANPFTTICQDQRTYLDAVASGDPSAIEKGLALLRRDAGLLDPSAVDRSMIRYYTRVATSAARGDPTLARQDYRANCLPLPSPSATSS